MLSSFSAHCPLCWSSLLHSNVGLLVSRLSLIFSLASLLLPEEDVPQPLPSDPLPFSAARPGLQRQHTKGPVGRREADDVGGWAARAPPLHRCSRARGPLPGVLPTVRAPVLPTRHLPDPKPPLHLLTAYTQSTLTFNCVSAEVGERHHPAPHLT